MGPVGGGFKPVGGEFKRVRGPVFALGRVWDARVRSRRCRAGCRGQRGGEGAPGMSACPRAPRDVAPRRDSCTSSTGWSTSCRRSDAGDERPHSTWAFRNVRSLIPTLRVELFTRLSDYAAANSRYRVGRSPLMREWWVLELGYFQD